MLNTTRALIIRLLVVAITGLTISLHAVASDERTLLVFGDSLSAGYGIDESKSWVNLLANKLTHEGMAWRVVNASVSGETTTGGLSRLPASLQANDPDLVILELGGAAVLLAGIQIPPNYGPRYTEPFFATYSELSVEQNVPLIPFLIDGIPQQPELMQDDGIHPVAEAQAMIVDNVWPYLLPLLQDSD